MVNRDSPYLTTEIFLHAAVWYLFNVVSCNDQTGGNVFVTGSILPLVTRLLLEFVTIQ